MSPSGLYLFLILAGLTAANIPWLSDRFLIVYKMEKNAWWRWLEWLIMYLLTGILAAVLEYKMTGVLHDQDWEFFVTTLSLFVVFALPGFIYHYDLKNLLKSSREK